MSVNKASIRSAIVDLLKAIGEDPDREGLMDTPDRVARWWAEFIDYEPGTMTLFESDESPQLVVVSGIKVWSLCEHHLLPFWCDIAIGYRPDQWTLGLSKFARIAQMAAHRLQVQERLVAEIAADVARHAGTQDVAVMARGEHLCMSMRGVRSPGLMTTTEYHGAFGKDPHLKAEFLALVK